MRQQQAYVQTNAAPTLPELTFDPLHGHLGKHRCPDQPAPAHGIRSVDGVTGVSLIRRWRTLPRGCRRSHYGPPFGATTPRADRRVCTRRESLSELRTGTIDDLGS